MSDTTLPDEDLLFDLAELFKIFGDSTRIKILFALLGRELAVNDIADVLGMTQSAISHQLRVLKTNGLVRYRREGKSLIYALSDEHVSKILNMGLEHIEE
ncbi:MAG: helix-turn-helix transcriptional regulator [Treponema sp.]|uniref:ArsR/SmtB family transcription factor n=1 Tax=Treponema sp. TaxID=166 RepID=UPI0025E32B18|nr:metalloregulator ArsR/SmtB family transcription factor [Treponema sp.]MBQ9282663.1 helix-turn-helix transcriptional regulator [Treponema sp.]